MAGVSAIIQAAVAVPCGGSLVGRRCPSHEAKLSQVAIRLGVPAPGWASGITASYHVPGVVVSLPSGRAG